MDKFFTEVLSEQAKAQAKHGTHPTDRIHSSAILNEEAGKLTQACIDFEFGLIPRAEAKQKMKLYALRIGAAALGFYQSLPEDV